MCYLSLHYLLTNDCLTKIGLLTMGYLTIAMHCCFQQVAYYYYVFPVYYRLPYYYYVLPPYHDLHYNCYVLHFFVDYISFALSLSSSVPEDMK